MDVADRNGIDPGERFIQHQEMRPRDQRTGNFHTPALTARQSEGLVGPDVVQPKILESGLQTLASLVFAQIQQFENRQQVLLRRHASEH